MGWRDDPVVGGATSNWQNDPVVTAPIEKILDKRTGAPAAVRAAVGAATKPEDRLATLQKKYPDAQPYEDDNFTFTNPRTRRKTLYNPPGFDVGDVASVGPEVAEMFGGAAGAALAVPPATAAAIPTGGMSYLAVPAAYGLGAAGGREGYTRMANTLLGSQDSRSLLEQGTDIGVTAGVNAVGGRVAELAGQGINAVAGPVARGARNLVAPGVQQTLRDFQRLGITPTAGSVTGNRGVQMLEHGLANTPGGGSVMQRVGQANIDEVAGAADRMARGYGNPLTAQGAGERVQQGAQQAADRFAGNREMVSDALEGAIGRDTFVGVRNVTTLREGLEAELARAPQSRGAVLTPAIETLRALEADAAANGGRVPFGVLRQVRTELGRAMERPDVTGYRPGAEGPLARAYGALSDDIGQAARNAGPDAEHLLRLHDRYVRFRRSDDVAGNIGMLDKIAGLDRPEQAFQYAMSLAKEGGTRLSALRRNMAPEQWDHLAATVLQRMGTSKGNVTDLATEAGEFSISTFLTNMKNLSPEARTALFGGTRYDAVMPELNALLRSSDRLLNAQRMGNPSGTARNLIAGGGVALAGNDLMEGDFGGALGKIGAVVVAPHLAARMLTSPRVVRAIAGGLPQGPVSVLSRLALVSGVEPKMREEIYQFMEAIRDTTDTPYPIPGRSNGPGSDTKARK
jgi:hypothetical protein